MAILVANGFKQAELTEPLRVLEEAGAVISIVSPESDRVKGWDSTNWGEEAVPAQTTAQRRRRPT